MISRGCATGKRITEQISDPIQTTEDQSTKKLRSMATAATMILVLLALAVSHLTVAHAAKAYIADLLPDLEIETILPQVTPPSHDGVQEPVSTLPRRPSHNPKGADFETKPGHSYTLLLTEEDGDLRWLVVNAHEDLTKGDVVVEYSDLRGRRRFVFVVFDQGFTTLDPGMVANLTREFAENQFDLKTFSTGFGFDAPLAARSIVAVSRSERRPRQRRTQDASSYDEVTGDECIEAGTPCSPANQSALVERLTHDGILPHFLEAVPPGRIFVDYGRGRVIEMGKFYIAQKLWILPLNVSFDMNPGNLYTLFLTDITVQFWQYWMIVNIGTLDVYGGDEIIFYSGPFPTTGAMHSLVFLAYSQGNRKIDVKSVLATEDSTLDPRLFAKEHRLGDPVAFNYFLCKPETDEAKARKIHDEEGPFREERSKEIAKRRKTKTNAPETPVAPLPEKAHRRSGADRGGCVLGLVGAGLLSGLLSLAWFTA